RPTSTLFPSPTLFRSQRTGTPVGHLRFVESRSQAHGAPGEHGDGDRRGGFYPLAHIPLEGRQYVERFLEVAGDDQVPGQVEHHRSEEHTSELQSLTHL